MGIKQFNADVRAAIGSDFDFPYISNIRRGDSDGELCFTYNNEAASIEIQALSTEPEAYPRHPGFLLFTSSDETDGLKEWLQEITSATKGKSVTDVITFISKALTKKLGATAEDISSDEEHVPSDIEDMTSEEAEKEEEEEKSDDDDASFYDVEFDDATDDVLPSKGPIQPASTPTSRLKRHLREARTEGFHVWIPKEGGGEPGIFHIFSLSIRASKLKVSEEALGAWGLKSSEYVVMLFKLPSGYPPLSSFLRLPSNQTTIQFKLGKCDSPNPSYASAIRVFDRDNSKKSEGGTQVKDDSKNPFLSLYMSLTLDELLNKDFPGLLSLRLSKRISWDQAQELHFELSRGTIDPSDVLQYTSQSSDRFELQFLQQDYLPQGAEDINVILIAMQFGLQRLVKCTNYCLVCKKRIEGGFEGIKPFVCEDSLCLFQYLTLGFCQSIEYEIINSPNVVDLLISFFYAAITSGLLREFPKGLELKVAPSGFVPKAIESVPAEVCFESNSIRFSTLDYAQYRSIKEGKYITLVLNPSPIPQEPNMRGPGQGPGRGSGQGPGMRERYTKYVCMIESCLLASLTFKVIWTYPTSNVGADPTDNSLNIPSTGDWQNVVIYKHEQDIDGLKTQERNQALTVMSECIPPVHEMRQYLITRPGCQLSSWKRMDTSTLRLLNWIVASNRSFIVQDAPIPGLSQPEETYQVHNLVNGIEPGWVQFRFVQGSPEKEEVFLRELTSTTSNGKPWPTLFAWHGSALGNWHSIIRTGLDFAVVSNGRAFGNGVYFAKDFETSRSYSRGGTVWSNSALKITDAISLCEIVNNTARFVSTQPYFVVNKVDWIQCRYLFIQVDYDPTSAAATATATTATTADSQTSVRGVSYIEQDPAHPLVSMKQPIGIPQSAIPVSRRRVLGQKQISGSPHDIPTVIDEDEPDFENRDLDDLLASDGEDEISETLKRRRASTDSGIGYNTTPFQPGQLDLGSLPKLAEPTWAASSPAALRALNNQIKELQKIQSSTNISALGWYIDFEKIDNLFHWIVQLHSFDMDLTLAQDMIRYGCSSIVLEVRFGASFPISPPFVRVIRPRFVPFAQGGGGHVTMGGSICSELLTNSGWSPALSLEKVFLEVRMNLCEKDPPARIEHSTGVRNAHRGSHMDYGMFEAVDAYRRAATAHGWQIPSDLEMLSSV
ncbi:hypothetical protein FPOAC2_09513 [Fusarium poae]|uniref:hypothetical protein n=1 Tax=Fusarium poae TaxID=36050 RepID=UPI001CEBAC09|nr:hypothetical protein FPOAC1_009573 [Fusarium poae]KAG8670168.1 hypothetical protein FPOAC1_009573 [Fusarium poae]